MTADEFRILRRRQAELREELDRQYRAPVTAGVPTELVQVYNGGHMPTSTGKFFLTHPATLMGAETEGGAGSFTVDSTHTVPVFVTGSRVPAAGDYLIAQHLDYRWVAESGGKPKCTGRGNKLTLTLTGCGLNPVPGASVDFILGGSTVSSTTTNGSGIATYNEPDPGTYSIRWTISGITNGGAATATVPNSCNNVNANESILGYMPSGYSPFGFPPRWYCCSGCFWPWPNTLYLTAASGTHTLTGFINVLGVPSWGISRVPYTYGGKSYYINYSVGCDGLGVNWYRTLFTTTNCSAGFPPCTNDPDGAVSLSCNDSVGAPGIGITCDYPFAGFSGTIPGTSVSPPNCGSICPVAGPYTVSA
jgi:hypothetical protein